MRGAPGCELYVVNLSADEPDTVWVTEVWADEAASDRALSGDLGEAGIGEVIELLAGPAGAGRPHPARRPGPVGLRAAPRGQERSASAGRFRDALSEPGCAFAAGVVAGLDQAGHRHDRQDDQDHAEADRRGDLRHGRADVDVQPVQDQLDADEGQDQRQPRRQVDQPVQQALDEEEQRPQAEQRERVRREDDVGLLRDAEDRGDRVEGEQQVDAADGDRAR